jgi:hypothetical protein
VSEVTDPLELPGGRVISICMKNKVFFRSARWAIYFFMTVSLRGAQTLPPPGIGAESLEYPYPIHFMEFEMPGNSSTWP